MVNLRYAQVDSPSPGIQWQQLTDGERRIRIIEALKTDTNGLSGAIAIAAAKEDGQVIVNLVEPLSAAKRGQLLLDFEVFLKQAIDPGITVWLEPLGDRNSLRNLRGIEVKA